MRLCPVIFDNGGAPVDGYGPGFFRIGGIVHEGPVVVLPLGVQAWQGYQDLSPLIAAAPDIDVLFIGTGATIAPIPPAARKGLEAAGLGIENMSSPSACRTYNVLLSEGRRVGLAVLPV